MCSSYFGQWYSCIFSVNRQQIGKKLYKDPEHFWYYIFDTNHIGNILILKLGDILPRFITLACYITFVCT